MTPGRSPVLAAAMAIAAAATGCGFGPGESSQGEATLTVTRDYGSEQLLDASEEDPAETETVIRFLDREADITTRYGGGFIQSIDGLSGGVENGRSTDWFFYVNGIEADRGGADVRVRGGDRIWWDLRDWTAAMRVPAVVGSWPEPFAQGSIPADDRHPVAVECMGAKATCDEVRRRLEDAGVDVGEGDPGSPRVLVGPWERVRDDDVAVTIEDGPAASGVFADFEPFRGGRRLLALDERGEPAREDAHDAGLVAALRPADDPPTWVVTGTDPQGVEAAAGLLGEGLADRYAVVADSDRAVIPLPVPQGSE